ERVTLARERTPFRRRILHQTRDLIHGPQSGTNGATSGGANTRGEGVHHRRTLATQIHAEVTLAPLIEPAGLLTTAVGTAADLFTDAGQTLPHGFSRPVCAPLELRSWVELVRRIIQLRHVAERDIQHPAEPTVQYLKASVHSRLERLGERVRQFRRDIVDRLHPVGEGVLHLVLDLVERLADEFVSPVQLSRIDVHAQLMQLDGLEGILQLRDVDKVAADSPIQHLERDTQLLKALGSTRETELGVERGHQLIQLFEFARDRTPELVDPGNL